MTSITLSQRATLVLFLLALAVIAAVLTITALTGGSSGEEVPLAAKQW